MSVTTMLGVADPDDAPMRQARDRWPMWVQQAPDLDVVSDLLELPGWTRRTERGAADVVLRSLARLNSPTGADDAAATTALTWLLAPGAAGVAYRLSDLTPAVDELVASHLWTSARTFDWRRHRWTAASILRQTARGVMTECGVGDAGHRADPTWSRTVQVEPSSTVWEHVLTGAGNLDADDPRDGREGRYALLLEVFDDACETGTLTARDRQLLVDLAVASDEAALAGVHTPRGRWCGLLGREAVTAVRDRTGMSTRTIQRRAGRCLRGLHAHVSGAPYAECESDHLDLAPGERTAAMSA